MAESATRPKPQWDAIYNYQGAISPVALFPSPPCIVQREAAEAKRSSRLFFSLRLSSANPPDHPPGWVSLFSRNRDRSKHPPIPQAESCVAEVRFSLFLRSSPIDPRADDDGDSKGRNRLFGHFKSHNLYADDDRMDVFQALSSPHDLPVGRYEHRRGPGGPPPQRVSVGPKARHSSCEHDAGQHKCRAREDRLDPGQCSPGTVSSGFLHIDQGPVIQCVYRQQRARCVVSGGHITTPHLAVFHPILTFQYTLNKQLDVNTSHGWLVCEQGGDRGWCYRRSGCTRSDRSSCSMAVSPPELKSP